MKTSRPFSERSGFTLVEMLAAIAVFAIIALAVAQMVNTTANITVMNSKHTDANSQARMVFDRMANDFARMVKRPDVDYIFSKGTGSSGSGQNDTMFFYTEAASYFTSVIFSAPYSTNPYTYKSSISLVGYRINNSSIAPTAYQMERLGKPLTWDSGPVSGSNNPTPVVFLTYPSPPPTTAQLQAATSSPYCGNPTTGSAYSTAVFNSTLAGAFSNYGSATASVGAVGTQVGNFNDCSTSSDQFDASLYHPIGTQVFRFEYSFQLRDGTQSNYPVMAQGTAGNPNGVPTSNLGAGSPPLNTSDSAAGYGIGSRWYDTSNQIGYICIDATAGAAVWHEIGVQDISAIVVTIAVMDNQGLVLLNKQGTLGTIMPKLQAQLADSPTVNPASIAQTWTSVIKPTGGVSVVASATGLPQSIVSQIRVYQRFFYINNL